LLPSGPGGIWLEVLVVERFFLDLMSIVACLGLVWYLGVQASFFGSEAWPRRRVFSNLISC
jgi:hypothetical protein